MALFSIDKNSVVLITIGAVQVLSIFFPSWFDSTQFEAVFRVIVLLVLGDMLFRLAQISPSKQSAFQIIPRDEDAQKYIVESAKKHGARSAYILSSGLGSRTDVIIFLSELGIEVTVFYQDISKALDEPDAKRGDERISHIYERLEGNEHSGKIHFCPLSIPSTIRATILYDSKDKPIVAQVGWYTYMTKNKDRVRVYGSQHPSLLVSRRSVDGLQLLDFLHETVLNYKDEVNRTSLRT
jgi:hypothetical protein